MRYRTLANLKFELAAGRFQFNEPPKEASEIPTKLPWASERSWMKLTSSSETTSLATDTAAPLNGGTLTERSPPTPSSLLFSLFISGRDVSLVEIRPTPAPTFIYPARAHRTAGGGGVGGWVGRKNQAVHPDHIRWRHTCHRVHRKQRLQAGPN